MTDFTYRIKELRGKIDRRKHLESMTENLQTQYNELLIKCDELYNTWNKEENDVVSIEEGGLTGFFLNMFGKKEERLDKERREAYAAKAKYDSAEREKQAVKYDLDRYLAELESLQNADEEYAALLKERVDAIGFGKAANDEDLLALEENLYFLENNKKELDEAIAVGNQAATLASEVIFNLEKAEELFVWDVLFDSMLVDFQKHDFLDKARHAGEKLQQALHRFRSELADVTIDENIDVVLDDFLSFADFFFDGLFSSMAVNDRIKKSKANMENARNKIYSTLRILGTLAADNEIQQQKTKEILNTSK
ncbi:MAG: hypothetical protein IKK99_10240 [Oscillospiraceae bacterium]|nr:hypothetical protein [Oscillospiraceae bacterium]